MIIGHQKAYNKGNVAELRVLSRFIPEHQKPHHTPSVNCGVKQ